MAIRAVVHDLRVTLIERCTPSRGAPEMMQALRDAGIRIAVASNHPAAATEFQRSGLRADLFLPSPTWGGLVVAAIKLQPHRPRRCTRERSRADSSACDFDESSRLCARSELPGDPPRA